MKKKTVECKSLGIWLPEKLAVEMDSLVEGLPADCRTIHTKAYYTDAIQVEPKEREEVSIITNATVDKTNEVVLPAGIDLESYKKSNIVLWNHNHDMPIATSRWVIHHKQDNSLRAKTYYPPNKDDGETDWFTDHVWGLIKCEPPVLKAKSIGFLPRTPKRAPTEAELQTHPDWDGSGIYDDTILLEYSCVSVGANSDALVLAVNNKSLDSTAIEKLGLPPVKTAPPKKVAKKKVDQMALVEKAIKEAKINPDNILRKALALYRSRGKV